MNAIDAEVAREGRDAGMGKIDGFIEVHRKHDGTAVLINAAEVINVRPAAGSVYVFVKSYGLFGPSEGSSIIQSNDKPGEERIEVRESYADLRAKFDLPA